MVKTLFILITSLTFLSTYAQADKYLADIQKYNESSVFEDDSYNGMTWQTFYALDEAKEFVDPMNFDYDLMNAALFFALNKYRIARGASALAFDPRLRDAASIHTDQMVKKKFFAHDNPYNTSLRALNNRVELCGFFGQHIAENIARMYVNMNNPETYTQVADKVILYLSRSKEHNINMLDNRNKLLGCSLLFDGTGSDGYFYFRTTHDFGVK
jgi:uncharacterized protein YkwD